MPFPAGERRTLLALKGVGATVVRRLEQMGIASLRRLAAADASEVGATVAGRVGFSFRKNSPQARAAIRAAIDPARSRA